MSLLRRVVFVFFALLCGMTVQAAAPIDFKLLRERVTTDLAVGVDWAKAVPQSETHAAAMTPQGAWPDIDYANRHITVWRMPSSSRAYPRPVEWKAAFYQKVLETLCNP